LNPTDDVVVKKYVVGYIQTNMYCLIKSDEGIIIDPGFNHSESEHIIARIRNYCQKISAVFLTHAHYDHISGLQYIKDTFASTIYCHENDQDKLQDNRKNGALLFGIENSPVPNADVFMKGGEIFTLIGLALRIIHTPGHTSGGVSILVDNKYLFSGDTVFKDGIGRTDFYDGSYEDEIASITQHILTLPDNIVLYPGHGPKTTVYDEKKHFQTSR
jgi:hydroxyacylglutathione hydrolase